MPPAPLPAELLRFLEKPRQAVVGTVRADGTPVTTPCWYDLDPDGRLVLSMDAASHRLRHLRAEPRLALSVLGDDWYSHVSLLGRAVELRPDPELADIDGLSHRYLGEPYEDRAYEGVTVVAEVERWHTYGDPAAEAD
ncbi:MAG TPA: TIGR03618 family F420-dependent PPOX class oxidoreductase [Gaiellaceae bacterium]|nr:TIGR03618 family F420-dependent PPOX class oxidoreductase [Gaiellaceae bacterium]